MRLVLLQLHLHNIGDIVVKITTVNDRRSLNKLDYIINFLFLTVSLFIICCFFMMAADVKLIKQSQSLILDSLYKKYDMIDSNRNSIISLEKRMIIIEGIKLNSNGKRNN